MADAEISGAVEDAEEYSEPYAETFKRLAALPPAEYESVRKEEAKRLGNWRVQALDREVAAMRPKDDAGNELGLFEPDPWPEKVDGDDLLDRIAKALCRHVAMPSHTAEATALWIVHTYAFHCWQHTPRLNVGAPEKNCGKSTLLNVLSCLVPRALKTENLSTATMFRVMDGHHPTLLVDEVDTFLRDNDELRGALNAGHEKGGKVLRCEGDDNKVKGFETFGPAALAGIGSLPGTLADRSIHVTLQRRHQDEHIEGFRSDRCDHLRDLASQAMRWTKDHESKLRNADPVMPGNLLNRRADNWRPLLAIADASGGDWPDIARQAAVALSNEGQSDTESIRTMLLADIKGLFDRLGGRLASSKICEELTLMEERPWPEFSRGKPITARQVAKQLGPLSISPGTTRLDDGTTAKGYKLESFKNAFARYLTPSLSVTTSQPAETVAYSDNLSVTNDFDVTDRKPPNPAETATCDVVTDGNPLGPPIASFDAEFDPPTLDDEARGDAEERAAIQEFDGVPDSEARKKLTEIPPWLDRREP